MDKEYEHSLALLNLRNDAKILKLKAVGNPPLRQTVISWESAEEELLNLKYDKEICGDVPGYEWRDLRIRELETKLVDLRKQIYA